MSLHRPNIGSRMNREVHVRVWERAEVKLLRATRQKPKLPPLSSKAMVVNVAEKSEGEMPRNGESTESDLRKARLTRSAGSSQCGPTLISPQSRDVNLCAIIGTSVQP